MADQAKDQTKDQAAAKATLKEQNEARAKARDEQAKSASGVKPTPTQEENDLAKMGVHITEHEPDGSPEQPGGADDKDEKRKQLEAKPGTPGYTTRSTQAPKP